MSRNQRLVCAFALVALMSAVSLVADDAAVRAGKWEVTTSMDIPGMPFKMKPIVQSVCVSEEDAKDPNKSTPKASKDDKCKVVDYKIEGNKASWKIKCDGQEEVSGTGEMSYAADSYEGKMSMAMGAQNMTTTFKGKRLGECTKK